MILFLFFNGGGLTDKQWFTHPYKTNSEWLNRPKEKLKSDLISKLKSFGDIYLYTPIFNASSDDIINGHRFTSKDLDLTYHCTKLHKDIEKYDKIIIISHSRGWIIASHYINLYHKNIIGYINIDGGETIEFSKKRINGWNKLYQHIDDDELDKIFNKIKSADSSDSAADDAKHILSGYVKYMLYRQNNYIKHTNVKMYILNNIYNDTETQINDINYINETVVPKLDYNKYYEDNENVKSIYYVGKTHFLYFYEDVVNDMIEIVKKLI